MPGENFVLDFKFGGNAEFLARLESLMRRVDKMFDATAEDIKETTQATNELNKAAQKAEPSLNKMSGGLTRLAGALKSVASSYIGLQGISKLLSFGNGSIDLYNQQLRQERQLQTVLRNKYSDAQFDGVDKNDIERLKEMRAYAASSAFDTIKQHAANIQGRTIYGDEAMIAGAGELATYVKNTSSMTKMMDLLADYAAGMTGGGEVTPKQMVDLATGLGKAFEGTYDAMRRKGFDTSELERLKELEDSGIAVTDDQKISALEKSLKDWAGLAETFAQTDEGKIVQIKNTLGDMREEIGKKLLPVVTNIMSKVQDNMPKIQRMMDALGNAFIALGDALSSHMDQIMSVGEILAKVITFAANFPALSASVVMGLIAIKNGFLETAFAAKDMGSEVAKTNSKLLKMNKNTAMLIGGAGLAAGAMAYSSENGEAENASSGLKGLAMAAAFGASQFGPLGAAISSTTFVIGGLISAVYQLMKANSEASATKEEIEARGKDMDELLRLRKEWKEGKNVAAGVNYQRALSEFEAKWGSLEGSYLVEGFGGRATMGKALDEAMAAAKNGTPNVKVNSDNTVSQTVNMETSIAEAYAVMRTTLREFIDNTIKSEDILNGAEMAV